MNSDSIAPSASLKRQLPSFVAIGAFGYVVDASITYFCARALGVDPFLARFPGFIIATLANFALNRAFTFAHSTEPLWAAFVRYVMVCAVGLAVNYAAYAAGLGAYEFAGHAATPAVLPVFVAFGSGVAMFFTYFGFRLFAFRV
jgi:putative flippase GtrA